MHSEKTSGASDARRRAESFVDAYAMERIEYRLRVMSTWWDLSEQEKQDYRHDMVVQLLKAMRRFDPARAKRETFINRVLDRYVKYIVRTRSAKQERPCETPIQFDDIAPGFEPVVNDPPGGHGNEQSHRELRLDLEAAIARMPGRLQRVCELLKVYTPVEAAAQLGMIRQSFYPIMREIRRKLSLAGIKIPKNNLTESGQLQM
jgi:RNA polymerase sigma-70 factor (ECF subfamily)